MADPSCAPTLSTSRMAERLGVGRETVLRYRERFKLREGVHYVQLGVGMHSPRLIWDPEAVEAALGIPKHSPPPSPPPSPMAQVVAHLLDRRHSLKDVATVDCLALAQLLLGQPPRKIQCDELREVMGSHTQNCLGNRLRRLRRAGLIEYQAGRCGDPGYQFMRIGPLRL